jgi:uncharacterized OsmC-like protein
MAKITPKIVTGFGMTATCPTHARTEISIRDLHATIDEPEARGGTNRGPSPTETLIASLVGCTNVIAHRLAEASGVLINEMTIGAEAKFDRRGVRLEDEIEVPFPEVTLTINVTTAASDADIERLKTDLGRYCPLTKVLTNAGTLLEVVWNVTRP